MRKCSLCGEKPVYNKWARYCGECCERRKIEVKRECNRRHNAQHRSVMKAAKAHRKPRTCLACDKRFMSWGAGNRICDQCKQSDAYQRSVPQRGELPSEHRINRKQCEV